MYSVLVVDDHDSFRSLLRTWTDALGYRAREADGAEAALAAMSREPCDVMVVDVEMPGHGGIWLAGRVRERFPQTAIVMATGARDVETAVASLRNEVVDYLLKPFDRSRLAEALALAGDWHASVGDPKGMYILPLPSNEIGLAICSRFTGMSSTMMVSILASGISSPGISR